MRLTLLSGAGVSLVVLAGISGYFFGRSDTQYGQEEELACRASLDISTRKLHFSGSMKFYAADGHGILLINGSYRHQQHMNGVLNRKVLFTYTRHGDMLYMISQRVDTFSPDNAVSPELETFLPRFFFMPQVTHNIGLYKQGDGYIFSGVTLPFAYCLKGVS